MGAVEPELWPFEGFGVIRGLGIEGVLRKNADIGFWIQRVKIRRIGYSKQLSHDVPPNRLILPIGSLLRVVKKKQSRSDCGRNWCPRSVIFAGIVVRAV